MDANEHKFGNQIGVNWCAFAVGRSPDTRIAPMGSEASEISAFPSETRHGGQAWNEGTCRNLEFLTGVTEVTEGL